MIASIEQYKLIIFDVDGTLAARDSHELLPGVLSWFDENRDNGFKFAIATNQGGVGLRHWMEEGLFGEPEKYPTAHDVTIRIEDIVEQLDIESAQVYKCYRYQSKKTGQWSPIPDYEENAGEWSAGWRKPAPGMLLYSMHIAGVEPEETLMVGDSEDDSKAAANAGCDFILASEFFETDE